MSVSRETNEVVFSTTETTKLGIGITPSLYSMDVNQSGILLFGADTGTTGRTNSTRKDCVFACPHYNNTEEPVGIFVVGADNGNNYLNIGGASTSVNAATSIRFYTAANSTTVGGTERMIIDSSGKVGIGTSANLPVGLKIKGTNAEVQIQ